MLGHWMWRIENTWREWTGRPAPWSWRERRAAVHLAESLLREQRIDQRHPR